MTTGPENARLDAEHTTLARSLPCDNCGYDLRGLRGDGVCPECGHAVWSSIEGALDPTARRLPALRNPSRVGDALAALVAVLLIAALLLFLRPLARLVGSVAIERWHPVAAGLVVLFGLWPVCSLAPPAGEEPAGPVRRDLRLLALGLVLVAAGCLATRADLVMVGAPRETWRQVAHLALVVAAVQMMVMLRRLLVTIGERSRQFRTDRGRRQGIRELIVAVIGAGLGTLLILVAPTRGVLHGLATLGTILRWTCSFMLVIGLVYLLVNVGWIRKALRRPPPTLGELFGSTPR